VVALRERAHDALLAVEVGVHAGHNEGRRQPPRDGRTFVAFGGRGRSARTAAGPANARPRRRVLAPRGLGALRAAVVGGGVPRRRRPLALVGVAGVLAARPRRRELARELEARAAGTRSLGARRVALLEDNINGHICVSGGGEIYIFF
jgi:hypothetical protein